jgi:integrase
MSSGKTCGYPSGSVAPGNVQSPFDQLSDHALYAVALGLGLREGELLGLRWAGSINDPGIDLEHGEVRVYQQLQFGRLVQLKRSWHRRVLPLSPWLVTVLERHATLLAVERQLAGQKWREHGLVFASQVGTPRKAGNLWLSWKRLQKRLGLGEHTFHDLRHTFATLALHAGVPLWKVSKLLGHRDITITLRVYGHLTPEGREDVAGRMEEALGPRAEETAVKAAVRIFDDRLAGAVSEMETAPMGLPAGM